MRKELLVRGTGSGVEEIQFGAGEVGAAIGRRCG